MLKKQMSKISMTSILLIALLCLSLNSCTKEKASESKRPNILLIISDDFGVDVTSDMYPDLIGIGKNFCFFPEESGQDGCACW